MSDPTVREVQLGRKHLVFLFMASVVVAVGIFLLGISVGRGLRPASLGTATTTVDLGADHGAPAVMPPPTQMTPADGAYHDALQGQTPPVAASPASAPVTAAASLAEPPAPVDEPHTTPSTASAPIGVPAKPQAATHSAPPPSTPAPAAAASATASAPASPSAATPDGGWVVQVGAFSSRENADHLVARLKTKGYTAFVFVGTHGTLFRVRVGPYTTHPAAEQAAEQIKREEGFSPSVTH